MAEGLYPRPELVPLTRVTSDALKLIRIGEDFVDLSRLGLIGEYTLVPATDICPTLYYRWNYGDGVWEIYACEHDLIGFNLGTITDHIEDIDELKRDVKDLDDRVTVLEGTTPEPPTIGPTEEPTEEPTEPDLHSKITQDADKTGGDLKVIVDGGIIIFSGEIEYYKPSYKFPTPGNYVGVTITANRYLWNFYKNTLRVKYKGMTFDQSVFVDGKLTLYVYVSVPGQETPIRFYWNDGVEEDFTVAITQESTLKSE